MNATSKPILLLGSYGRGNIGDDAFLVAAMRHLPEDAKVYLNSSDDELLPKVAQGRVQTLATTRSTDLRNKVRAFRKVKHVVYCGGDLWVELHNSARPRSSLYKMLGMNLLARISGKKVYYLGCGVGDLQGYSLALARMSANLANVVIVREPRSAKLLGGRRSIVLPDLISSLGWPVRPDGRTPGE
ncbi:MAG TPA: polysaccharide pyruvyl transferase family protein, partial [Verrucomicrobiae bacterium]|nr:polysaccharide pyruvyl transferase family protein [Verrucomicrobiae bacterium]